jgi:hypothetical protein
MGSILYLMRVIGKGAGLKTLYPRVSNLLPSLLGNQVNDEVSHPDKIPTHSIPLAGIENLRMSQS